MQRSFHLDGWKAVGTGLNRISLSEVIRLDILKSEEIDRVLDEVQYAQCNFYMIPLLTNFIRPEAIVHCKRAF